MKSIILALTLLFTSVLSTRRAMNLADPPAKLRESSNPREILLLPTRIRGSSTAATDNQYSFFVV